MHLYIVQIAAISARYIRMSRYTDESWCLSMGVACRCVFRNVLSVGNKQEVKYCV
jgi:hypothetical protein